MKYDNQKPEEIKQRTFRFAVEVITFCRSLPSDEINKILIRQIIRSATSIGANLEEAAGSRTRADFTHCTNIAKKEARETNYWLRIIYQVNSEKIKMHMDTLIEESNQIISILTSTVKKLQTTS